MMKPFSHSLLPPLFCAIALAACAADANSIGDPKEVPPPTADTPAEAEPQSAEEADESTVGESDKALREKRCCVVKNYACDVGHPACFEDSNPEVTTDCNTMTGTQAGVKIACFGWGIGASSRVVRDGSCGRYNDCSFSW